MTTGQNIL